MNTSKILATATIAALLSWSVQAHNGVEHDGAYVEIDGLTVAGGAGTVNVSGAIVFGGDTEFVAFDDPAGDSLAPGQGLDITTGSITMVDSTVVFTMGIADLPLGDVQPGALYNWNIGVTGATEQRLFAWRNNVLDGQPDEWHFAVITFSDDGFSSSGVTGEFTGDSLVWEVAAAQIGGKAGARIGAGNGPITASQGGFGPLQLTEFVDYDTANWDNTSSFTIGGGVTLELIGPGDYEEVLNPRIRKEAFEASFDDLAPGTYTLTVTSGYADVTFEEVFEVVVA